MGWNDEDGKWVRAMSMRAAFLRLASWMAPAVMIGIAIVPGILLRNRLHVPDSPWLLGVFLLLQAVHFVFARRRARLGRELCKKVQAYRGEVCPYCRVRLTAGDLDARCERCGRVFLIDLVGQYWMDHAFKPAVAHHSLRASLIAPVPRKHWSAIVRDRFVATPLGTAVYLPGWGIVSLGLALSCSGEFSPLGVATIMAIGLSAMVGVGGAQLLVAGRGRRVGEESCCARCDYSQPPGGTESARCPECGAFWNEPSGLVKGRLIRSPALMWTGLLLLILGVGMSAVAIVRERASPVLPTALLIQEVTQRYGARTGQEWAELSKRPLSEGQTIALANRLLDRRMEEGRIEQEAELWFTTRIAAGALPEELVDRYYGEWCAVRLEGPERVGVGKEFTVTALVRDRMDYTYVEWMYLLVGGFRANMEEAWQGRMPFALLAFTLDGTWNAEERPKIELAGHFRAESVGIMRVEFVYWIAAVPAKTQPFMIEWQADGTPARPKTASRFERRVVERIIDVVE